jgi:hypothetical protein
VREGFGCSSGSTRGAVSSSIQRISGQRQLLVSFYLPGAAQFAGPVGPSQGSLTDEAV